MFEVGDQIFNIRVRASTSKFAASGKLCLKGLCMRSMTDFFCHHDLQLGPTADAGFLYGYVFFRQKKDPTIRRGYFQASSFL